MTNNQKGIFCEPSLAVVWKEAGARFEGVRKANECPLCFCLFKYWNTWCLPREVMLRGLPSKWDSFFFLFKSSDVWVCFCDASGKPAETDSCQLLSTWGSWATWKHTVRHGGLIEHSSTQCFYKWFAYSMKCFHQFKFFKCFSVSHMPINGA